MLINYVPGEECRIAIARDERLEEFYQERASTESHVGNIYKGRVTNVESSIQAAFIDFGLERNGFLHISDLHPMYFPGKDREEFERVGSKTPHRQRPPIQKCLKKGQEVLVQVLKEGIGTKGPTLTTYLSIPGRFIVMMPYMERLGVSRKVEDDDARRDSRKLLNELNPPEGFGFIIRTAGIGQTKTDLKRDLAYLQRLWKDIESRRKKIGRAGELYTESDLIIRTIRDVFSNDIDRVIVDHPTAARQAHDFLTIASPRARSRVVYYHDRVPLFHRFGIEQQIERIHDREVPLPSGGSLVIDSAEALVAIDVNSGKSRDARDAESNAYNTNREAVDEIARQLRLRDLGGVIVNDLIDMRDQKHRRQIESRLRQNFKRDRARTRIGPVSQFGLIEMTRQRMRPSLQTSNYNLCHVCHGEGYVKSAESVVLDVMRRLHLTMQHEKIERIELTISPDVAFQLLNRKRAELTRLEHRYKKSVMVRVGGHSVDHLELTAYDSRGMLDLETLSSPKNLPAEADDAYVDLQKGELPAELVADADAESEEFSEPTAAQALESAKTEETEQAVETGAQAEPTTDDDEAAGKEKAKRRRRRRGGRGRRKKKQSEPSADAAGEDRDTSVSDESDQREAAEAVESAEDARVEDARAEAADDGKSDGSESSGASKRKRRRRGGRGRRRGSSRASTSDSDSNSDNGDSASAAEPAGQTQGADEPDTDAGESQSDKSQSQADDDSAAKSTGSTKRKRSRKRKKKSNTTDNTDSAGNTANTANTNKDSSGNDGAAKGYSNRLVNVVTDTTNADSKTESTTGSATGEE